MKATNYSGIDYSCGLNNCDHATGIRYGVISCDSVQPDALDSIFTDGEDVAYSESLEIALKEARIEWESAGNDPDEFDEDQTSQDFSDNYQSDGGLRDYAYTQDGYKLTGCLDNDLFVLASPFFTYVQFCSPCVPGAGNLDNPFESSVNQAGLDGTDYASEASEAGFPRVYCLGHDWFESGAPYAVFSVETGKIVVWGEATS